MHNILAVHIIWVLYYFLKVLPRIYKSYT